MILTTLFLKNPKNNLIAIVWVKNILINKKLLYKQIVTLNLYVNNENQRGFRKPTISIRFGA